MVTINLGDPNVVENFKALNELRKTGVFTDEQLQRMYDKQVEADRKRDDDET
jgi:hypothetical protein